MAAKDDKDKKTAVKDDEKQKKTDSKAEKAEADANEDIDEGEELDELVAMLEEGELTDLNPEEAIESIDEWYEILHSSKDDGLKELSKSLKQLKKVLSSSKAKEGDIAEALSQLGEQTNTYADDAQRGYKTKLHKLGKSFIKASKSLEQTTEE